MNAHRKVDHLRKLVETRSISRREFMSGAMALGISTTAATSMWSGAAKAAPHKGGHLRVGTDGGASIDSFNPKVSIGTDHVTQSILSCYDTLTEIDGTGTPVASLAESWETSADGATWRFKLRKGSEFHNGKSVTAADVVWSLQQHLADDAKYAEGKQIVGNLAELKADGADTVIMVQKEVNFDLPAHLSSFGLIIGPEGTSDWNAGIGTGPYALENYDPGVSFAGKRHANFYRDDQGLFDTIELTNIADATARSNALRTGTVDVIGQPDTKTANRLDKINGISLLEVPGNQHYTTAMRTDTDPFTNNHLRLAIKHGIKRDEILQKIFGGFGYVGNDIPIGRNTQFFNDQLPQREFDADKAKFHLNKAGLSGLKLDLSASDGAFSGSVDMSLLMQASLKEAGLDINVKREAGDGYWSNVWLKRLGAVFTGMDGPRSTGC